MHTFNRIILGRRALTAIGLIGFTAAAIGFAAPKVMAADGFNGDQKREIETVIHDYLMKNPQVLVDAMQVYQQQQHDASTKAFTDKVGGYKDFLTSDTSPYAGNAKGDVTVVEFFDYNCGYCKHAVDDVSKLVGEDKNVKVIFKDYPILAPSSEDAAKYALAAQKQGKYFEFHQKLMKFSGEKNEAAFRSIAKDLNMDFDKLKADSQSPEIAAAIDKNKEVAHDLGIDGTPSFIFGKTLVPGYIGVDEMKHMVDDSRQKKG